MREILRRGPAGLDEDGPLPAPALATQLRRGHG